ncbi:hypothetical protein DICA1_C19218 [Diutina catenulata]
MHIIERLPTDVQRAIVSYLPVPSACRLYVATEGSLDDVAVIAKDLISSYQSISVRINVSNVNDKAVSYDVMCMLPPCHVEITVETSAQAKYAAVKLAEAKHQHTVTIVTDFLTLKDGPELLLPLEKYCTKLDIVSWERWPDFISNQITELTIGDVPLDWPDFRNFKVLEILRLRDTFRDVLIIEAVPETLREFYCEDYGTIYRGGYLPNVEVLHFAGASARHQVNWDIIRELHSADIGHDAPELEKFKLLSPDVVIFELVPNFSNLNLPKLTWFESEVRFGVEAFSEAQRDKLVHVSTISCKPPPLADLQKVESLKLTCDPQGFPEILEPSTLRHLELICIEALDAILQVPTTLTNLTLTQPVDLIEFTSLTLRELTVKCPARVMDVRSPRLMKANVDCRNLKDILKVDSLQYLTVSSRDETTEHETAPLEVNVPNFDYRCSHIKALTFKGYALTLTSQIIEHCIIEAHCVDITAAKLMSCNIRARIVSISGSKSTGFLHGLGTTKLEGCIEYHGPFLSLGATVEEAEMFVDTEFYEGENLNNSILADCTSLKSLILRGGRLMTSTSNKLFIPGNVRNLIIINVEADGFWLDFDNPEKLSTLIIVQESQEACDDPYFRPARYTLQSLGLEKLPPIFSGMISHDADVSRKRRWMDNEP